jgi:hypothetical protein
MRHTSSIIDLARRCDDCRYQIPESHGEVGIELFRNNITLPCEPLIRGLDSFGHFCSALVGIKHMISKVECLARRRSGLRKRGLE